MSKELQNQLKGEEDKLAQLEEEFKKKKAQTNVAKVAEKGTKNNSCCKIM